MQDIHLKRVTMTDIVALQQIAKQTFAETFSASNSHESVSYYLEDAFSTMELASEVSNESSLFYFAMLHGGVVGYLKLNTGMSQTELQDMHALEIERIYVLSAYHGKKVGQLLYDKAMEIAEELKSDYVWLGVWEENPRAICFYQKNGFVEFDKHLFKLGKEEQVDILMKKVLRQSKAAEELTMDN